MLLLEQFRDGALAPRLPQRCKGRLRSIFKTIPVDVVITGDHEEPLPGERRSLEKTLAECPRCLILLLPSGEGDVAREQNEVWAQPLPLSQHSNIIHEGSEEVGRVPAR